MFWHHHGVFCHIEDDVQQICACIKHPFFFVSVHVVYTSFSFSTKNNSWLLVPIGLKDQQENCVGGNKTLLWPEETFACCCAEPPFVAHVKKDP